MQTRAMQSRTRKRRRKGPPRGMASLHALVPKIYPSNEPEELRLVRAIAWWERHVPPRVARSARPAKLSRGVLVVHAVTGAWAQEVSMLLPTWLPGLERAVPGVDARKVRVQVGPLPPRPPITPPYVPQPPIALTDLPDAVAAALVQIPDDPVRDAIARAAAQSLSPRRGGPRTSTR
jgi:hypothetical protein